jgi:hypothetical protein
MMVEFDIWNTLKSYINNLDRASAAENFIAILIDEHGADPAELRDAFKSDKDLRRALDPLVQDDSEPSEDDEDDEDEEFEYDDENWED